MLVCACVCLSHVCFYPYMCEMCEDHLRVVIVNFAPGNVYAPWILIISHAHTKLPKAATGAAETIFLRQDSL